MKDKRITIPAIISLIIHAVGLSIAILVTSLQNHLSWLYNMTEDMEKIIVFPSAIVSEIIALIIVIIFTYLVFNYQGNKRRVIGIVLFALMVGISIMMIPINFFANYFYGMFYGTMYLAKYGVVNNAVSIFTSVATLGGSPLFFVALGRFGITDNNGQIQ